MMNALMNSLLRWAKDPFGRKEIKKHDVILNELYAAQALAQKTKDAHVRVPKTVTRVRVIGGVNAIDRALLGNQSIKKDT